MLSVVGEYANILRLSHILHLSSTDTNECHSIIEIDWRTEAGQDQRSNPRHYYAHQIFINSSSKNPFLLLSRSPSEPTTFILGQPEMFIDTTSTINLTCIVQGLNEPPTYIQWTHNGYEINYDRYEIHAIIKLRLSIYGSWVLNARLFPVHVAVCQL